MSRPRREGLERRARLAFGLWVLAFVVNLLVRPRPPPRPVGAREAARVGTLLRQGRQAEALAVAEQVLSHPGSGPRTRLIVAAAFLSAGNAVAAEAVAREHRDADPMTPGLRFVLLEALRAQGREEEVPALARRFAAAAPLDPGLGFQAARTDHEAGDLEAARARLAPLAAGPGRGYAPVQGLLARVLLDQGRSVEAAPHIRAARKALLRTVPAVGTEAILAAATGEPPPATP